MKTALIILTGVFLIFYLTMFLSIGKKKAWALTRWFFVIVGLGLFGIATTPYSLPLILFLVFTKGMNLFLWIWLFLSAFALLLALLLKNVRFNPFWWWLDDSRLSDIRESGYSEDYEIYLKGKKETLWTAYGWHMRNRLWNFDGLFLPKQGTETNIEFIIDNLTRDGKKIQDGGKYVESAGLKFINENGVEGFNVNNGKFISKKYSTIGESMIWYNVGNWLGFRYSFCELKPFLFFWKRWHNIKLGTNRKRFVSTIKYQKDKVWQ